MRKIEFWKMSGAGNDFVLLTGSGRPSVELRKLAVKLCERTSAVGADGLLYVGTRAAGGVSVRYFNRDGTEAFCGNGSRCAALWAGENGLAAGRTFMLETMAGELEAEIISAREVRMRMPDVEKVSLRHKGAWSKPVRTVHLLDTGVPHAVVPVDDAEKVDVAAVGRALRLHKAFGTQGVNVNFAQAVKGGLKVRTYERGVEGETLACGTGITASAIALGMDLGLASPVKVEARSGDFFKVWYSPSGEGASDIRVQGPARIVFKGEIYV